MYLWTTPGGMSYNELRWMSDISKQKRRAQRHRRKALDARARELEDAIAEQALLNQSLLVLLLRKGFFTREEMAERLQALDLLDGVEDGKLAQSAPEEEP